MLTRLWKDEDGLTSVEYALLLSLIVVASITVWNTFGAKVRTAVEDAGNAIEEISKPG